MKKKKILLMLTALALLAALSSCYHPFLIGNGKLVTNEKTVSSFGSIQISGAAVVNYHTSGGNRVVFTTDSNVADHVEITTRLNTLHICMKPGFSISPTSLIVDVYGPPELGGVTISGASSFTTEDRLNSSSFKTRISGLGKIRTANIECNEFDTSISGSGEISGNVNCSSFTANISGTGKISLTGKSDDARLVISGVGVYEGFNFETKRSSVNMSGSGTVNIWTQDHIIASVSGMGLIKYRGEPSVEFRGSGMGRIEKAN